MSRTLSGLRREGGISLETPQWKKASAGIEGRISWFFSSCGRFFSCYDGVLRDTFLGPQGDPVSTQVVRGPWGFLCCICRGPCLYLELRSRADMYFGISLGRPEASQGLVSCEPCKSALLSTRKSSYSLPISLTLGNEGFLSRCHRAVTPGIVF